MLRLFTLALAALLVQPITAADVFAHFMVGNTYAYNIDQWKADMQVAKHTRIDGFALNWTPPDCQSGVTWFVDRINDAFTAAEEMDFKLMHSFDMSYSVCDIFWNQTFMADMISRHAGSSAAYRWNSNILVSTYGGDQVDEYGNDFFQGLKDMLKESNNAISLAPALTKYAWQAQSDPSGAATDLVSDYPSIDGYLNWQAWPLDVHQNISIKPDEALQSGLKKAGKTGPYIMAVSPWQFKDLDSGNPMDAWVAYSDTLFPDRFDSLLGEDAFQPDIIELLTWNDFAESHYIRDLPPQDDETATDYVVLGDMGNYVWGIDHAGWRRVARYYIHWWKDGKRPEIHQDHVVYWYRIHPKAASCSGGSPAVRNSDFPSDAVFAWALVKEPATISMSLGSNKYWDFTAEAGVPTMGMVDFPDDLGAGGATPEVAIVRDGKTVHRSQGAQPVTDDCSYNNFNPVVGVCGP